MTMQFSDAVRNAAAAAKESAVGVSPRLRFYSGAVPANCAAARTGTLLAEIALPADWMVPGIAGQLVKNGAWSTTGLAAASTGTAAGYFAVMDNAGTTCHHQGTVTATGGGGDMTIDNVSIASGQAVVVQSYSLTEGNG